MDFTLTIQRGGFAAFEKTGIYPEFLLFHSAQLGTSWRVKLRSEKQNGFLKLKGQIAFHYYFDDGFCKMQSVTNGVVTSEWYPERIVIEMRD
ncbi:hypothetical protein FEDK69T_02150 [Flavobacterium enshiense DK69]|uniref:Uncharacterized protein n=1 Tax=Flavobacterium enshiense DK69 TaxID=1107311 RepID=V6SEL2_9FLAO|nr:hypothetical protein [Flavobacterium enshiense]ESU25026.1 hypothetical protein FEDK69T_02150 [Flavobacterium enshiense DK69]KGO96866.1 hypothetical protein Q767_03985 [Flavobacterium enshiense DK69]